MNFLVDAQLPARLARFLRQAGHDVVHTSDLPDGNRAPDRQIAELADGQSRVVVSKNRDFRDSTQARSGRIRAAWLQRSPSR
jgi:predicted nuclease of predicted toxin-antitoxin system